jgi:hypothetical protein
MMLNCGHDSSRWAGLTGQVGYGEHLGGYTMCYGCIYLDIVAAMRWETTLFAYDNGTGRVTDWPGNWLGDITRRRVIKGGVASRLAVDVIDIHGQLWRGTGPTENGTYLRLHKVGHKIS